MKAAPARATSQDTSEQGNSTTSACADLPELPDSCAEGAHYWLDFGFKPIPLENKTTTTKWDKWLSNLTHASITTHWKKHPQRDVGAIVDDELFIVDADTQQAVAMLREIEKHLDIAPNMIHNTSKGEHHFFRRAPRTYAMMKSYSSSAHPEKLDIRTGRSETEGRSMIALPPSSGKKVFLCEAVSINDLVEIDQVFIDAIFRHNGEQPPRPREQNVLDAIRSEASQSEALEIVSYINPDLGYNDWLNVLMGLHHEFKGDDVGLEIADQWSSKGKNYPGPDEVEYKWRSFTVDANNPVTFRTACKMAELEGAELKAIARNYDENGNRRRTYEDVLASASVMGSGREYRKISLYYILCQDHFAWNSPMRFITSHRAGIAVKIFMKITMTG